MCRGISNGNNNENKSSLYYRTHEPRRKWYYNTSYQGECLSMRNTRQKTQSIIMDSLLWNWKSSRNKVYHTLIRFKHENHGQHIQ